jgi:phage tail-like protein
MNPPPNNQSSTTKSPYPLTSFCFQVELMSPLTPDKAPMFFRSVSGLKFETEIIDLREGGVNHTSRKLIGGAKWSNLIFKRGFAGTSTLLDWRNAWMDPGQKSRTRLTGKIIQLSTDLKPLGSWAFERGLPVKWEISDFDASKSELSIETLEIAHEGLVYTPASGA